MSTHAQLLHQIQSEVARPKLRIGRTFAGFFHTKRFYRGRDRILIGYHWFYAYGEARPVNQTIIAYGDDFDAALAIAKGKAP